MNLNFIFFLEIVKSITGEHKKLMGELSVDTFIYWISKISTIIVIEGIELVYLICQICVHRFICGTSFGSKISERKGGGGGKSPTLMEGQKSDSYGGVARVLTWRWDPPLEFLNLRDMVCIPNTGDKSYILWFQQNIMIYPRQPVQGEYGQYR